FNERTVLSSFRVGFSFVGSLFAAAGIPFITDIVLADSPAAVSYTYMGIFFGVLMIVLLSATVIVAHERVAGERQNYDNFFRTIMSFLQLKEFREVAGLYMFHAVGSGVIMALSIFFLSDVPKVGDDAAA